MKMLRAPNGYTIPFRGRWPLHEASYLCRGQPRIFWYGRGWFSYKTTGPKAWTEVEVPEPPQEPDGRFDWNQEAWAAWQPEWLEYARVHGAAAAAGGLLCCDMVIEEHTMHKLAGFEYYPPSALMSRVRNLTGVDPYRFNLDMLRYGMGFVFDLIGFIDRLARSRCTSLEEIEKLGGSVKDWIGSRIGKEAAEAVDALVSWRADEDAGARHRAILEREYHARREAMALCRSLTKRRPGR